jgi:hypothetical protein
MECPTCGVDNPPEALICECGLSLQTAEEPKQFVFKSNEAAFQYACQFLNTSIDNERPVLGIVLGLEWDEIRKANKCCVKLSNPDDSFVPTTRVIDPIIKGEYIYPGTISLRRVPTLCQGDLAMCVAPVELATIGLRASKIMIVAKAFPIYNLIRSEWKMDIG